MPLIYCKVELSLSCDPNCVLTSLAGNLTFAITDAKLYVPIVTLSIENNAKLSKLLSEEFKRPIYWNKYKVIWNKTYNTNVYIRELLDPSYQGVKRLFVIAYDNTAGDNRVTVDSHRRYFLLRVKIARTIQQIIFTGKASADVMIYYILEQSKETILQFSKGTTNVL